MFADSTPLVSPGLLPAVVGSLVFVILGGLLLALAKPILWKMADRMTPGNLDEQLVPPNGGRPNVALAIVVGSILAASILGMAVIIAASIH